MYLEMSSGKWQPFCPGDELTTQYQLLLNDVNLSLSHLVSEPHWCHQMIAADEMGGSGGCTMNEKYYETSNIRCTKSQNLNVFVVSLPTSLKPGVKSAMKM